ncbi:RHS repeat-associated core domain-containing protein [Akkermansia muciniphila]|uniref:RHS repeat-associated core domain-containing protein n=1 Tax=Akkermansia muciniphila TaxID=239935 RepID=UPI003CE4D929
MEGNAAEDNPFRFSSEYADDELGLVYYNYRYYNPQNGLGGKPVLTHDLLKNTTALFGIRAGRRALYEYGPYGNILRMEGNAAEDNPFRFSSEYADDELGLVYYNYRYYNPQNGRWISRDPAKEEKTNNLYWFVRNHPSIHLTYWEDNVQICHGYNQLLWTHI